MAEHGTVAPPVPSVGSGGGSVGATREERPTRSPELDRLIGFTDAVVAIALTILVLDLRVPAGEVAALPTDRALLDLLGSLWPSYIAFGVSFAVISVWWWTHHRMFRHVYRYDGGLLVLGLLWLATIVFLPFPTSILAASDLPAAVAFYACAIAAVGFVNIALLTYLHRRGLVEPPMTRTTHRIRVSVASIIPAVFLASIAVAYVIGPAAAQLSWVVAAIAPSVLVPLERRRWGTG